MGVHQLPDRRTEDEVSLNGFEQLRPVDSFAAYRQLERDGAFHYDDLDGDPEDINIRRRRERWHCIEWTSREDDRIDRTTGQRIWPVGSGAMMYDPELDWILNGQDDLTFQEWETAERPMAIHAKPIGPTNRVRRETLADYL